MRRLITSFFVVIAGVWPAYDAIAQGIQRSNIVTMACILVALVHQHGKNFCWLSANFFKSLGRMCARAARWLYKVHTSWDDVFPPISELGKSRRISPKSVDPIKESISAFSRPTFPRGVAVTLAVISALALAGIYVASFSQGSSQSPIIARSSNPNPKASREDLPATFADRFVVPQGCNSCGGPEVDLVPLPKPNPLRSRAIHR